MQKSVLNKQGKFGVKISWRYTDMAIFVLRCFILTHPVLFNVTGADGESLASANSSFDRASLTDDQESVQTRTSMASLRRRRLLMTSSPQFSARLRPKRCVVGQTVRFSCCVSGLPEPNVTWSRADGTTLTNSKRIRITVCCLTKSYTVFTCLTNYRTGPK